MTVIDIHARRDHGCEQQPPVLTETPADAGPEEARWVDPRELIIGDNVSLEAALDKGFVADIAERGVRQIIPVRRDESTRLVVRTGQGRVLGAIEAGLARVRVVVETEQLTDNGAPGLAAELLRAVDPTQRRRPVDRPDPRPGRLRPAQDHGVR
jgi:hypothetical protein